MNRLYGEGTKLHTYRGGQSDGGKLHRYSLTMQTRDAFVPLSCRPCFLSQTKKEIKCVHFRAGRHMRVYGISTEGGSR